MLEDGTTGFFLRNLLEFGGLRQGAYVAGSFGLECQESLRNPGAREPERLCSYMARWFDSFGQSIRQSWRTTITSVRGMYFHYYAMLCGLLSCYS